jgi:hypothetical protein
MIESASTVALTFAVAAVGVPVLAFFSPEDEVYISS